MKTDSVEESLKVHNQDVHHQYKFVSEYLYEEDFHEFSPSYHTIFTILYSSMLYKIGVKTLNLF